MGDGGMTDDPAGEYNLPDEAQPPKPQPPPQHQRQRKRSAPPKALTPADVARMPDGQREEMQAQAYQSFAMGLLDLLGSPGVHHGNNPSKGLADVGVLMGGGPAADPSEVLREQTSPQALARLSGQLPGLWQEQQGRRREERREHVRTQRRQAAGAQRLASLDQPWGAMTDLAASGLAEAVGRKVRPQAGAGTGGLSRGYDASAEIASLKAEM